MSAGESKPPGPPIGSEYRDPVMKAKDAAMKAYIEKAEARVAAEPKVKAQREREEALLPDPLAPNVPMNPMAGTGNASFRVTR